MTQQPNMENKLGKLWFNNVRKLMAHFNLSATGLARFIDRSESTTSKLFGSQYKRPTKVLTIEELEDAFSLKRGILSNARFDPVRDGAVLPTKTQAKVPVGYVSIPVYSIDQMDRIRRILDE